MAEIHFYAFNRLINTPVLFDLCKKLALCAQSVYFMGVT